VWTDTSRHFGPVSRRSKRWLPLRVRRGEDERLVCVRLPCCCARLAEAKMPRTFSRATWQGSMRSRLRTGGPPAKSAVGRGEWV
jgi:hypothetical protein